MRIRKCGYLPCRRLMRMKMRPTVHGPTIASVLWMHGGHRERPVRPRLRKAERQTQKERLGG